ncbi:MAG: baseplate J/gp47 family protein, partial [Phaeodactylibacter sp.]|nr:baseplate J/gp47 family protein [Phaeodactylibacter sp.]
IFESLMKAITQIVFEGPRFLQETLEDWPAHQPHVALYLAFLQLYAIAQRQLNGLKERHVDYYYKEVLRLKEKGATPDTIHLLIELAKQVEDYLLKEGTAFKAGKDSESKEVIYKAPSDTALNKAQVSQLKSVYYTAQNGKVYAAPITNSEDGQGAELLSSDGQWKPFGPVTRFRGNETQVHPEIPVAPPSDAEADTVALFDQVSEVAEVGFAIASPNLFLREGTRGITLKLTASLIDPTGPPVDASFWQAQHFSIYLTGEEGWIRKFPDAPPTYDGTLLTMECTLSAEDPPVLPYDAEIHGEYFDTTAPVIKVLAREHSGTSPYNELKKLKATQVYTEVSVTGVRNLIVQNELGRLDPSKPFLPFGGSPHIGSALIIGNKEVFQKKLATSLKVNIQWDGLADAGNSFVPGSWVYTGLDYLENNGWQDTYTSKLLIKGDLSDPQASVSETDASRLSSIGKPTLANFSYEEDVPFSIKSKDGYIRLRLKNNFGHKKFMREYPKVLIELSKVDPDETAVDTQFLDGSNNIILKDPPYIPSFKELSLDYTAASTFNFSEADEEIFAKRTEQFFHVSPFGQRERHPLVNKSGADVSLVPLIEHEGNLYIGIASLKPKQSVSVLFQVAEGSANPLAEKQKVEWYYLYQNNWMAFSEVEDADVADSTNGLLQSGIIQFFLPRKINDDNTLLPPGHTWLRASVGTSSDAISNMVSVDAQAVKATFYDQGNAEDFLASPLAEGTIKKLQKTVAAVKKVNQPYSSFGGKVKEKQPHFYKRVSERLRHKDRAITIWDYEHLVLEAFPDIYKVKCLNHTRLRADPDDPNRKIINEIAPGYVLFVAVPDLKQRNAVDPLKPYTSLNTLDQIKQFLQKRISPQVQLDVVNPLFESVYLDFEVEFHDDRDFTLYSKILEQEIIQFLSPWAFDNADKRELEFGGSICKSVLLDFVEERPYVDFVTQFRMDQFTGPSLPDLLDIEEARASTSRSILVSYSKHNIKEVATHCV